MSKCYKRIFIETPLSYIPLHKDKNKSDDDIVGYYLYVLKCKRFKCVCFFLPSCLLENIFVFQEPVYS